MASLAKLAGAELPANAAPDSLDHLAGWLGEDDPGRAEMVVEGVHHTSVMRVDDWTMIPPHEGEFMQRDKNVELGNMPVPQLYDLTQDIGQIRNLAEEDPDRVAEMQARLDAIKASTATRPGYAPR